MTTIEVISTLFVAIVWLLSLAGHLVLLKILLTPRERVKLRLPYESSRLHLLSVTGADLVALLLGLPFTSLYLIFDSWDTGLWTCNLSSFVKIVSVTVSSYCIVALLMQCYEMVVKGPNRSRPSPTKQYLLLGCIWALALITSAPLLFSHQMRSWSYIQPLNEDLEMMYVPEYGINETLAKTNGTLITQQYCTLSNEFYFRDLHRIFLPLMLQYVPAVLVVFLFIKVADSMNKKAIAAKENEKNVSATGICQLEQTPNDVKFVHLILTLSVVYCLLWVLGNILNDHFYISHRLYIFIAIFRESVFFIKPFLLFAANSNFRNALLTIGVATTDVEDIDGHQVGFSKMDNEEEQC